MQVAIAQAPAVQSSSLPHACPQVPQLATSVWVFVHVPLQIVSPA
jgi:hypothetical protein